MNKIKFLSNRIQYEKWNIIIKQNYKKYVLIEKFITNKKLRLIINYKNNKKLINKKIIIFYN